MQEALILIQYISRNFALFSCALFAGAATYVSLVERPALSAGGKSLENAYILFSQPRLAVFQSSFAGLGGVAGILAGIVEANAWWFIGGLILACAALFNFFVIAPDSRALDGGNAEAIDAHLAWRSSCSALAATTECKALLVLRRFLSTS